MELLFFVWVMIAVLAVVAWVLMERAEPFNVWDEDDDEDQS